MSTTRLETFADGVFAIAATLLILSVDGRVGGRGIDLGAELRHAWPSYVAYSVSFITIGIMWVNHHALMAQIGRVDRRFLLATVVFLMTVSFLPFPTRLAAEHIHGQGARSAALAYGFTMTANAVMFNVIWFYAAIGKRLLRTDADPRVVKGIARTYLPGPWIYLGATLVAFASPAVSLILYLVYAGFWVLENSLFGGKTDADL
jgi:uncharacterized membrane protein